MATRKRLQAAIASTQAIATATLCFSASATAHVPELSDGPPTERIQQTTADPQAQENAQATAGDEFDPSSAEDVGEIVVTAQKREQRIQDVPVTVNLVGAEQLEQQNITSVGELSRAVPALSGAFFGGGVPQIRGVATTGFGRSSESAVSTILDGVVMGRTAVTDLVDVERVEVLSGPQGMLFGKNASSGVINIVTARPKLGQFEVKGSVDLGRFEYERERLTVNVPITSNSALRLTGYHNRDESVVEDTTSGNHGVGRTWGARARLRIQAADNLELNFIGDFAKASGNNLSGLVFTHVPDPTGVNAPLAKVLADCGIEAGPSNTQNCINSANPAQSTVKRYGASAQIDYTLPGDYTFTSITANRWLDSGRFGDFSPCCDVDATPGPIFAIGPTPARAKVFTQELRVTSPNDQPVEFVAGLYYFNADSYDETFQAGTLGLIPNPWPFPFPVPGFGSIPVGSTVYTARYQKVAVDQKSYAAFGQATIHATDRLSLIIGGRYDREKLRDEAPAGTNAEMAAILSQQNIFFVPIPGFTSFFVSVDETLRENNFSWRLGAQYDFHQDLMVFATAARGYKGPAVADQGAFVDPTTGQVNAVVEPEIPLSFELGAKATFLGGRVLGAVTLFHTKIDDFQTTVPVLGAIGVNFAAGNAPYMTTKGVDVSVFGRPLPGLTISAGAIYNIAKFAPDYRVGCAPGQTAAAGCINGLSMPNSQVPNTPKLKIVANGQYEHDVTSNLKGFVQSDLQYLTRTFTTSSMDRKQRLPSQLFLNGRVGVRNSDGRWSASVWGRNLLGKRYLTYVPDFLSVAPGHAGAYVSGPNPGHFTTYGLSLDFAF